MHEFEAAIFFMINEKKNSTPKDCEWIGIECECVCNTE